MIAVCYGGFSLAAMFVSSYVVNYLAVSKIQLTELEFWKGLFFVMLSASLVFFFSLTLLQRVHQQKMEMQRHREALLAAERRAITGVFAAAAAHDINNTLSVFHEVLDETRSAVLPPEVIKRMRVGLEAVERTAGHLLQVGKNSLTADPTEFDFSALLQEMVDFASVHPRIRDCAIEVHKPEKLPCHGHPGLLRQMILNLMLNAAEATGRGGRIRLTLDRTTADGVQLCVQDTGPGVPPDYRDQLFDLFFTTKPHGTGLGLVSVRAAAEAHSGCVRYTQAELGGAAFVVTFPPHFIRPH